MVGREAMNNLLLRSLVLVMAGLLAVPPGWCCPTRAASSAVVIPRFDSCQCHSASHFGQDSSSHIPAVPPPSKCCCDSDTILSPSPDGPDLNLALATANFAAAWLPNEQDDDLAPLPAAPWRSPSAQVLHCVWLC